MKKNRLWMAAAGTGAAAFAVFSGTAALLYAMTFRRRPVEWVNRITKSGDHEVSEEKKQYDIIRKDSIEWLKKQNTTDMTVRSEDGLKLYGTMVWAGNDAQKTVICVHGFRSGAEGDFGGIMQAYLKMGVNVLLLDDRAHGRSEGNLLGFSWNDRRDVVVWAKFLVKILGDDEKIYLHGVSMGAAAVMMASGEDDLPDAVCGVIEDCGFTSVMDELTHVFPAGIRFLAKPLLFADSLINRVLNGYFFSEGDSLKQVKKSRLPFLLIHGADDHYVPTEMVYRIYNAVQTDKDILVVPHSSHAVNFINAPEDYTEKLKSFIEKY